jgi:hypothetical protein
VAVLIVDNTNNQTYTPLKIVTDQRLLNETDALVG